MTKKDFELIARVFRECIVATPEDMADVLQETNPRFDRVRFLKACEPKEG